MPEYSIAEYADIHFVYGECNGNALAAAQRYAERYPNRRIPSRQTFINVRLASKKNCQKKFCQILLNFYSLKRPFRT
jgi:hypothetical protein